MMRVLEPGRELDALIAEKVLGWTLVPGEAEPLYALEEAPVEAGPSWVDADGVRRAWVWSWSPSQQIADAWEVLEQLARHTLLKVEKHPRVDSDEEGWGWSCGVAMGEGSEMLYRYAPSAPLAICRAALALVDSEGRGGQGQSYSI
jgi:hypothetical protein